MKDIIDKHFVEILVFIVWLTAIIVVAIPETSLDGDVLEVINWSVLVVYSGQILLELYKSWWQWHKNKKNDKNNDKDKDNKK